MSDPRDPEPTQHQDPTQVEEEREHVHEDELADEMSEESFPSSDPPSTWAGHDHDGS